VSREERLAKNESLFREVNERIEEAASRAALLDIEAGFVCECASVECTEPLPITLLDYEEARSKPTWFIVLNGHERPDVERIVRSLGSCLIVDKVGEAGEEAEELDPRS
jgi:hypothetical protein